MVEPMPSIGASGSEGGPSTSDVSESTPVSTNHEDTSAPVDCESDACTFSAGLSNGCAQRFALGVNYAWHDFGADFGGLAQWDMGGIAAARSAVSAELAQMKANGVSVVRWWMFPDFRGDGVQFDANDVPTGLSATALLDIQTALELADEHDLYLVLTLFSFDNFRANRTEADVLVRSMTPLVADPTKRTKVIDNIVRPAAQAAATSPHAKRLLGWDVINEPEWAIEPTGTNDQDFTPNAELASVSLDNMKALINESLIVLGDETPNALRSVGWAAAKWSWAFADVANVEFNQPHIYGWVDKYWPYTLVPSELGYPQKPTVMGEFYMLPMPFDGDGSSDSFSQIVNTWYDNGYAGAWAWSVTDQNSGVANLPLIKSVADEKGCSVSF